MATEKRLIDANMLKANFVIIGNSEDLWHTRTIRKAIDNAPTVDAVEAVHGHMRHVFSHTRITTINALVAMPHF